MHISSKSFDGLKLDAKAESWAIQGPNIRIILLTFHEFNVVCSAGKQLYMLSHNVTNFLFHTSVIFPYINDKIIIHVSHETHLCSTGV